MSKTKYYVVLNDTEYEGIYKAGELKDFVHQMGQRNHRRAFMLWAAVSESEAAMLYVYGQYRFNYRPAHTPHFATPVSDYLNWSESHLVQQLRATGSKKAIQVTGNRSNLRHDFMANRQWRKLVVRVTGAVEQIKKKWRRHRVFKAPIDMTTDQEIIDAKQLPCLTAMAIYVTTDAMMDKTNDIAVIGGLIQYRTGRVEQMAQVSDTRIGGSSDYEVLAITAALRHIPKTDHNRPIVVLTDQELVVSEWQNFMLLSRYLNGELVGTMKELMMVANQFTQLRFAKVATHKDPLNQFVHKKINRIKAEYVTRLHD
jgi:hypothetical protein